MPRSIRLLVFVLLGLTTAACDSSGDELPPQLAGSYTLSVEGVDEAQGRAMGYRETDFNQSVPPQIYAIPVIPVIGGARFSLSVGAPAHPGVYKLEPTQTSGVRDANGCGGSESRGPEMSAYGSLFLSRDGSQQVCAAAILGGEIEVLSATDADTRFRFSFAAIPALPVGLPDTVRVSGTFTLALDTATQR